MNLSARNRKRLMGFMIFACVGVVLYSYVVFFVQPLRKAYTDDDAKSKELQEQNDKAEKDLRSAANVEKEYKALREELIVATNRFVLRPVLGSLLISAQNVVDPIARKSEVHVESYSEQGQSPIPGNKKDGQINFDRYALDVTLVGTYRAIREFVIAMEQSNPYVCVTEIDIHRREDIVTHHPARIQIEWPVFSETKAAGRASAPAGGSTP